MPIETWLAFVLATSVLLVIPGPTILTVISYAITHGKRATLPLTIGVFLGDATALLMSLAGLGAALATSAWLFIIIKWIGGVYLIYMGVKLLLTKSSPLQADNNEEDALSQWHLIRNTWLVTALNPKGIIFFIAFLPQFVDPNHMVTAQLWVLSLTFVTLATINAALYAIFAGTARKLLASAKAWRRFNLCGGSLLCVAGAWALSAKRA